MTDYSNIQVMRIDDAGELVPDEPKTWDGEPVWSSDTVQEGLFSPGAFEQIRGQLAMEEGTIDVGGVQVRANPDGLVMWMSDWCQAGDLVSAGLLRRVSYGPATYGHVSLYLVQS